MSSSFHFSCAAFGSFKELAMAPSKLALLSWGWPVAGPLISSPNTFRPRTAPPPAALRAASFHRCVAEANETSWGSVPALASILVAGACAAAFAFTSTSPLVAAYAAEGASENNSTTIFQRSCAGCHAGGGNILQPNATLFAKDLDRNGMGNVADVFQITYFGKGRMPGYGEKCTPRGQCTFGPRLSDADIRALAEFVRLQAEQGWPS